MVEYKKTEWDHLEDEQVENNVQAGDNIQSELSQKKEDTDVTLIKNRETKRYWTLGKILSLVVVASLVLGVSVGAGYRATSYFIGRDVQTNAYYIESKQVEKVSNQTNVTDSIPDIADRLGPNIVAITNEKIEKDFFFGARRVPVSGTGVVFNINKESILVVTNNHVVEQSKGLVVAFGDKKTVKAKVIGADADADIAVIEVKKGDLPESALKVLTGVTFGNSDKIRVGELAIAIGNPLGYNNTVTVGFISGIDRKLQSAKGRNLSLIQTDAAINPGNSGGALLNNKGELIGINTVKIATTEVEGIGFAVPINIVKSIIDEILEKGYVSKPYMGIGGDDVSPEVAELYNLPEGIIVKGVVEGSGADKAGLEQGDIIISVDDKEIKTMASLIEYVLSKKVGDEIKVTYVRNAQEVKTTVVLEERSQLK